jgi:hypothetical protein
VTSLARPSDFKDEAIDEALARLHEIIAIVQVIEDGDLLSALPADEHAAQDHQRGVSLLVVLHRELERLVGELGAAQLAMGVLARTTNRASPP